MASPQAIAALQACQTIGMPECRINLAHVVAYLSEAPKSTRAYEAYKRAEEAANLDLTLPVPMQMRNAPTNLMKELGYAHGYNYNPDYVYVSCFDFFDNNAEIGSSFVFQVTLCIMITCRYRSGGMCS